MEDPNIQYTFDARPLTEEQFFRIMSRRKGSSIPDVYSEETGASVWVFKPSDLDGIIDAL